MRHDDGEAAQVRFATINGLADWLAYGSTPTRVIVRRPANRTYTQTERAAMEAARTFLDRAEISILTRRRDGVVTYIAERVT